MKILLVLTDTLLGGITTAAINLANELVKRGNEVDLLNMCADDGNILGKLDERVKILHLNKKQQKWNLTANSFRSQRSLLKKLYVLFWGVIKKFSNRSDKWLKLVFSKPFSKKEYDVAIGYRQCAPCYYFVLNAVNAKIRVGAVHGELAYMGDISSWQKYMSKLDRIAYVSKAVENGFVSAYPELTKNAFTVYNMIDSDFIINLSNQDDGVEFDTSKFNIITVSRIENSHKQCNFIPEAAKLLVDSGIVNFHWYVVGDGPDFSKVIELTNKLGVGEWLSFVGAKNNPYKMWKNADLFAFPTLTESFGLVVVESLILNVPVVVCRYPALCEIFEDGKYGFVAEQNVDDFAEKIKCLIENNSSYEQIKNNCNNYSFTNDVSYEQLLKAVKNEKK